MVEGVQRRGFKLVEAKRGTDKMDKDPSSNYDENRGIGELVEPKELTLLSPIYSSNAFSEKVMDCQSMGGVGVLAGGPLPPLLPLQSCCGCLDHLLEPYWNRISTVTGGGSFSITSGGGVSPSFFMLLLLLLGPAALSY